MTGPDIPDAPPFSAGSVVGGKYRVTERLGVGGMGVVMLARHEALRQDVALKLLLPSVARDPDSVQRFVREAQTAARLRSDHVVRVFDVGVHESGVPYMVMERLEGRDLADVMEARGALPVTEAVDLVLEALSAIGEAHAIGLVHRDLKPSNLFLASRPEGPPRLKVLDFGISKITGNAPADLAALTSSKSLLGSPGYMSPEQIRSSRSVDARTDVWAMGVVLYELLTGQSAYSGETLGDIFAKIREEELPPIRERRPDVPAGLADVVSRCLRRARDERYADARELRLALLPFGSHDAAGAPLLAESNARAGSTAGEVQADAATIALPGAGPQTLPRNALGSRTAATWATNAHRAFGSRRLFMLALAAVALGAGALWWRASSPPAPVALSPSPDTPPVPVATATSAPVVAAGATAATAPASSSPEPIEPAASATASAAPARPVAPPRPGQGKLGRPPAASATPATPPSTHKKDDLGI